MHFGNFYRDLTHAYTTIPKRWDREGRAFPPLRAAIVITHFCNLRCEFCMVVSPENIERAKKMQPQVLTLQEIQSIVDQLPRYSLVTITGGEPTARWDFMDIMRYICRKHKGHFVTNGTVLNDAKLAEVISMGAPNLLASGMMSVGVSIEGPEELHDHIARIKGAWKKTVHAIYQLAEEKRKQKKKFPIIDIKVVITDENINHLVDIYKLSEDAGVDLVSYQVVNNQASSYGIEGEGDSRAHLKVPAPVRPIDAHALREACRELQRLSDRASVTKVRFNPIMPIDDIVDHYQNTPDLEHFTCRVVWSTMHIGPYGDVFPCYSYNMGNVRKNTLMQIWNGDKYKQFRKQLQKAGIFRGCIGCCMISYQEPNGNSNRIINTGQKAYHQISVQKQ
ncbi:MAG TPA: radical SAM protein [Acidobacteriota bacterium]|nr:radical SAM protein [Acidobacteriota bacterium]